MYEDVVVRKQIYGAGGPRAFVIVKAYIRVDSTFAIPQHSVGGTRVVFVDGDVRRVCEGYLGIS